MASSVLKVSPEALRGSASRVNGIAGNLENELSTLTQIIAETSSAWEGGAKDSFERTFHTTYKKNLEAMISSLREYSRAMNEFANDNDDVTARGARRFDSITG